MNEEEQAAYIVHHLTEGDDPKDLILDICQKTNLSWPEAEALVKQVQEEKQAVIARKQLPLLFTLALGIFIVGLGLIGYSVYTIYSQVSIARLSGDVQALEQNIDAMQRVYSFFRFALESGGRTLFILILGIAMVFGSLLGMRDTWTVILNR